MTLSIAPMRVPEEVETGFAAREPGAPRELEILLPPHLRRFGTAVRACLNGPEEAPVLVVLGGISANRHPCTVSETGRGWWPGVAGAGGAVDPARHRILGLDFIADETGACAPTPHDQAEIVSLALSRIGVPGAAAIIGASYGGMIALAFAERYPNRVERLVVISAAERPHPAATAIRELQRRVVALGLARGAGEEALSIARGLAMMTYRSPEEFADRFDGGIAEEDPLCCSQPGAYLRARGEAFRSVMSPGRFLSLSASIDRHRVDPSAITLPVLLIGATSDQLVPPAQMQALRDALPEARLHLLPSLYGHDMFLKEAATVAGLVAPFLATR